MAILDENGVAEVLQTCAAVLTPAFPSAEVEIRDNSVVVILGELSMQLKTLDMGANWVVQYYDGSLEAGGMVSPDVTACLGHMFTGYCQQIHF